MSGKWIFLGIIAAVAVVVVMAGWLAGHAEQRRGRSRRCGRAAAVRGHRARRQGLRRQQRRLSRRERGRLRSGAAAGAQDLRTQSPWRSEFPGGGSQWGSATSLAIWKHAAAAGRIEPASDADRDLRARTATRERDQLDVTCQWFYLGARLDICDIRRRRKMWATE